MAPADEMVPSIDLLRALLEVDPQGSDDDARVAAIVGWERMIAFCTAHQNELLAAAYRDHEGNDAGRWFAEALGVAMGISGGSAYRKMSQASTLVDFVPALHAQLRVGAITVHHARIAANTVTVLDRDTARAVDTATVADDTDWRTPSQLERSLRASILRLDPDGAKRRHEARRRERDVRLRDEPDGMCSLWARLTAEQGRVVADTVEAHARSSQARNTPGDDRTLAQRRADGLVDLVTRRPGDCTHNADNADGTHGADSAGGAGGSGGEGPRLHGQRPDVRVTVAWTTLMGLDDLPAFLDGYGPIGAEIARRIAHDDCAAWRRLLTDPASGQLLDYGRTTYTPPKNLGDFVIARDRFCRFPTCDRPAVTCDLDHRHDWDNGCGTRAECLDALCRRHHRLKHEGGWTHERDPDDQSSIWTDPTGRQHRKPATRQPVPPTSPAELELGDPPF